MQTADELRARVHGIALTAALPKDPEQPKNWDTSSAGRGWSESKVKRDTDPGEEGQFDFKDASGDKKAKGAAKKAEAEANKRAREARSAEAKRAATRRAAAAMARRLKARSGQDISSDIDDLKRQIEAAAAAHGSSGYPGRADDERRLALLQLELSDAALGNDAPIASRIALREQHLSEMRSQGISADIIDALSIDLDTFKSLQSEIEAAQLKRAEAAAKKNQPKKAAPPRSSAPSRTSTKPIDPAKERERLRLERKHKREVEAHRKEREMRGASKQLQGMAAAGKEWTADQRKEAAVKGYALEDGSYPIVTKADWYKARQALGRAKERAPVIRHLKKRAKALGIPESELDGITN